VTGPMPPGGPGDPTVPGSPGTPGVPGDPGRTVPMPSVPGSQPGAGPGVPGGLGTGAPGTEEIGGPQDVRWLQERLIAWDADPGPVDGILGPRTRGALAQFQQEHGLAGTGVLDEQTRSALAMEPKKSNTGLIVTVVILALVILGGLLAFLLTRKSDDTASTSTTITTTTAAPTTTAATTTTTAATTTAATTTTTTTTRAPALPEASISVSTNNLPCNASPPTLTWSTNGAQTVQVSGPQGLVSTNANGSQPVAPSRACSEAPFTDTYNVTASNAAGNTQKSVEVSWRRAGP